MDIDVTCADIGSVAEGNFGWYASIGKDRPQRGRDMEALANLISDRLQSGRRVALGIEAPLFIPRRTDPENLTKARPFESSRNWCGGPGGPVLGTGLVQTCWLLDYVRKRAEASRATLDWEEFRHSKADFFLWEAFIAAEAKATAKAAYCRSDDEEHMADAQYAVERFMALLPELEGPDVNSERSISLIGFLLIATGWSRDYRLLDTPCRVIKPEH